MSGNGSISPWIAQFNKQKLLIIKGFIILFLYYKGLFIMYHVLIIIYYILFIIYC